MWSVWNRYIKNHDYYNAVRIESDFFRPDDVFLMPNSWKDNPKVNELLPQWKSKRSWAKKFSFHQIMRMQARVFDHNPNF
jgi:hypothetical protein